MNLGETFDKFQKCIQESFGFSFSKPFGRSVSATRLAQSLSRILLPTDGIWRTENSSASAQIITPLLRFSNSKGCFNDLHKFAGR